MIFLSSKFMFFLLTFYIYYTKKVKHFFIIILVYIESLCFYYETKKYSDNLKMQNKKCLKIKSFYLVMVIFSKKHSNSKETEMRDSSTWDPDWRALYAATIWEQSMLCLVHSTRCRPGLTQKDIPLQLQCTSGQGAGPRFGWNKPIYLYSRCYKNCLCRVTSL